MNLSIKRLLSEEMKMNNSKLELTIVEGKLDINLINLELAQAMSMLRSASNILANRELMRMGCEMLSDRFNSHYTDDSINKIKEQFPDDPIAKTISDLVTPKQLVAIRSIANTAGINAEQECMELPQLKCRPEELSRRAASVFIDHLKSRAVELEYERDKKRYASNDRTSSL